MSDVKYKGGEPCSHKGCKSHKRHPCEKCGRTEAQGVVYERTQHTFE